MKIDFSNLDWDDSVRGLRTKVFEKDKKRIRLAEFSEEFIETDWCEKEHFGFVLEGEMEIDFGNEKILYKKGDGIFISSNKKHIARNLTEKVLLFLVEET